MERRACEASIGVLNEVCFLRLFTLGFSILPHSNACKALSKSFLASDTLSLSFSWQARIERQWVIAYFNATTCNSCQVWECSVSGDSLHTCSSCLQARIERKLIADFNATTCNWCHSVCAHPMQSKLEAHILLTQLVVLLQELFVLSSQTWQPKKQGTEGLKHKWVKDRHVALQHPAICQWV